MSTPAERPRLRELRLARGWTQADVAERLGQLAWSRHRVQIGVNANMVAKWERGAKGVSARYRRLLADLYRVTVSQLGLPDAEPSTAEPADPDSLVTVLDKAVELLDQLGGAGRNLRPRVLAALTSEALSRRTLLSMLDPGTDGPSGEAVDPVELDALADGYDAAYPTAAPATLMTAVSAHVRIVDDALHGPLSAGRRQLLLRNRMRVAIIAGRLAGSVGNTLAARAYFAQAADDAFTLGDHLLAAIAIGYAAELATSQAQPAAALAHLRAANALDPPDATVRSWLACIEATAHAGSGHPSAAREALDRAHAALTDATACAVAWFTDHNAPRLAAVTEHIMCCSVGFGAA
ncbi:MAG TPA: helix-turn-helix transcriptional regulator [Mycobacteriales bacterium]|nr:helix-turn-helix transcriptional regulator [Mycobacteriales bacterium]